VQPQADPQAPIPVGPTAKALNPGQYILEFNRSPVVGYRLKLQGIYDESRLQFTRPRSWSAKGARVMLHFRHSPALYATRSNLTVLVNGTSVGSVPLNKKQGEMGNAVYEIPAHVIQDYNEIVVAALQNNSPTCTQDPFDPSLWTEVMPDSKLVFDYQPQPLPLDFSRYPYPLFDNLSLDPNRIAYWLPNQIDETWLTATARLQATLGRLAQFRPLETRLINPAAAAPEAPAPSPAAPEAAPDAPASDAPAPDAPAAPVSSNPVSSNPQPATQPPPDLKSSERLVVIGTPQQHPALAQLKLPISLKDGKVLDEKQVPLPDDVGVLTLTTSPQGNQLVLVATGNGPAGVSKAVQFLVQARDRQIGTGQTLVVRQLDSVPAPHKRDWPAYLPTQNQFELKQLKDYNSQPLKDVSIRGADAPVVEFDFKALPDDAFDPGSVVNLRYSYSPQVNPLTSMVEVQLDGVPITGKRLDSEKGALRQDLSVPLPAEAIKPHSKLQVRFQLDPRERRSCNRATDQQLWATVHADSGVQLKRRTETRLPDLQLLQYGFPLAAPQDLSQLAIALPQEPSIEDLQLLLELTTRLGRLSRAESVALEVYRKAQIPESAKQSRHWAVLGLRDRLALTEGLDPSTGFRLADGWGRARDRNQVQALQDQQGLIKQTLSPWNPERVLLTLTAQSREGLTAVQDLLRRDDLFFQLKEDTALIKANYRNPSPYDLQAYDLEFLQRAPKQLTQTELTWSERLLRWIEGNGFVLMPLTVLLALGLYGLGQSLLKRSSRAREEEADSPPKGNAPLANGSVPSVAPAHPELGAKSQPLALAAAKPVLKHSSKVDPEPASPREEQ
jgi:cellulose synthase operon protein B